MCEYQFLDESYCQEPNYEDSEYCILHINLPEDRDSQEWEKFSQLKQEKFIRKVNFEDYNFEGSIFGCIEYAGEFKGDVLFRNAIFSEDAMFNGATFSGYAMFENVTFLRYAFFDGATFSRNALFDSVIFSGDTSFDGATFSRNALFDSVIFSGVILFNGVTFSGNAWYHGATFWGDAIFDGATFLKLASFNEAIFSSHAVFNGASFLDVVGFETSVFKSTFALKKATISIFFNDEIVSRMAKRIYDERGEVHEADYYYYREMVARCKQKSWPFRVLELPLQYVFFYGTNPMVTFVFWIAYIAFFAILYSQLGQNGFPVVNVTDPSDYIYFSLTNAMTPGYGGIIPNSGLGKYLACFEAICGTLFLASFITIFARKYMRA